MHILLLSSNTTFVGLSLVSIRLSSCPLPLLHLSVSGTRHRIIGPVFPARAVDIAKSELERDLGPVLCTIGKGSIRGKAGRGGRLTC